MLALWKKSYDKPRQLITKQRHYFADKVYLVKAMVFPVMCGWMWELDCKENWSLKNWCFWTVVLEKTLESPLDCKEIKLVNPKGNQSWIFVGRTDAEAETPICWPPDAKNWLTGKDLMLGKIEGGRQKGMTGWDGWMASPTWWTWIWASSGSWWGTGKPGVHGVTKSRTLLNDWTELKVYFVIWYNRLTYSRD